LDGGEGRAGGGGAFWGGVAATCAPHATQVMCSPSVMISALPRGST
jgi:hypothetical protein